MTKQDGWDGWIYTYTGRKFWPLAPKYGDVDPADVAHALSLKCRFTGHCSRFYSVGEHSLRVASVVEQMVEGEGPVKRTIVAYALLHDAAEAYLPDVARSVKPFLAGWNEIEERVQNAVLRRFGLPEVRGDVTRIEQIGKADDAVLHYEMRELFSLSLSWFKPGWMLDDNTRFVDYMSAQAVEDAFLARMKEVFVRGRGVEV